MEEGVYYRLYLSPRSELVTVVCMQWFDEYDYDQSRFVRSSAGNAHYFDIEDDAIEKLNEWFKPEEIDPEYRRTYSINLVRD